jgi:hypothetical protein
MLWRPVTISSLVIALTIVVVALLSAIHDWWGIGVLGMLMFARLLNVVVI